MGSNSGSRTVANFIAAIESGEYDRVDGSVNNEDEFEAVAGSPVVVASMMNPANNKAGRAAALETVGKRSHARLGR